MVPYHANIYSTIDNIYSNGKDVVLCNTILIENGMRFAFDSCAPGRRKYCRLPQYSKVAPADDFLEVFLPCTLKDELARLKDLEVAIEGNCDMKTWNRIADRLGRNEEAWDLEHHNLYRKLIAAAIENYKATAKEYHKIA